MWSSKSACSNSPHDDFPYDDCFEAVAANTEFSICTHCFYNTERCCWFATVRKINKCKLSLLNPESLRANVFCQPYANRLYFSTLSILKYCCSFVRTLEIDQVFSIRGHLISTKPNTALKRASAYGSKAIKAKDAGHTLLQLEQLLLISSFNLTKDRCSLSLSVNHQWR